MWGPLCATILARRRHTVSLSLASPHATTAGTVRNGPASGAFPAWTRPCCGLAPPLHRLFAPAQSRAAGLRAPGAAQTLPAAVSSRWPGSARCCRDRLPARPIWSVLFAMLLQPFVTQANDELLRLQIDPLRRRHERDQFVMAVCTCSARMPHEVVARNVRREHVPMSCIAASRHPFNQRYGEHPRWQVRRTKSPHSQ